MKKLPLIILGLCLFLLNCGKHSPLQEQPAMASAETPAANTAGADSRASYHQLLQEDITRQFGNVGYAIVGVQSEYDEGAEIAHVEYQTETGIRGSAAVVFTGNKTIFADGARLEAGSIYVVDCYGQSCCIEQYHPGAGGGYFSCSCSGCRMTVIQI